jgi:RNA polymerase sigma-70 factor (ECF subfamily)
MPLDNETVQIEKSKTDPQCFEPLYLKYYQPILKFVYKRVDSFDDCKEITATVFTKALTNISKYRHRGFPFSSWLYRIAINEITQFYRDTKKMRTISIDERGVGNIAEEANTVKNDLLENLKLALDYLSEDEWLLIELRYFEERPFLEVGAILGITESNAKVKTYRTIEKLKWVFTKIA